MLTRLIKLAFISILTTRTNFLVLDWFNNRMDASAIRMNVFVLQFLAVLISTARITSVNTTAQEGKLWKLHYYACSLPPILVKSLQK